MSKLKYFFRSVIVASNLFICQSVHADVLTYKDEGAWVAGWDLKPGITVFDSEGNLGLKKFRKNINATQDAHLFKHPTNERGEVFGGIWTALSNPTNADAIIDGDLKTSWTPDGNDELDQWIVQIDLGRAVLAKEIRIHFPDEDGRKPFRQFSVFASTGAYVSAVEDSYRFFPVYRTTKPNYEELISVGFRPEVEDTTRFVDKVSGTKAQDGSPSKGAGISEDVALGKAKLAHFSSDLGLRDVEAESNWKTIQFIRFIVDEKQLDGALAEIEVICVGDNVSLGVESRGGSYINGSRAPDPFFWLDGNLNTYGVVEVHQQFTESRGTAFDGGLWWKVDLGVTYWIDDAFMYWQKAGEQLSTFRLGTNNAGTGYTFYGSDGTRSLSGDLDYDEWIFEPEWTNGREEYKRHYRYLFNARKVRHIFWLALKDLGWRAHPMEFQMFSPGYPAEVVLLSKYINLGELDGDGQPKVIKAVHWEADTPSGTRIQLRTRSGNEQGEEYTFYNKIGEEITQEKWNTVPKVLRGKVDTSIVVGEDWSNWSNTYKRSGEEFKSDSPRRFVQMELILSTEDYNVAPLVRSLSVEYVNALVNGARGSILPKTAKPNVDTNFTYELIPDIKPDNIGFDIMRLIIPDLLQVENVEVRYNNEVVPFKKYEIVADSVLISMPESVVADSVQVNFRTKLVRNAAVIKLDLGSSDSPGLWQNVEPAERRSDVVLLPDLVTTNRIFDQIEISNRMLSPNRDEINDSLDLNFTLLRVDVAEPVVEICDLSGRVIANLANWGHGSYHSYSWNGEGHRGNIVSPGIYFLKLDANLDEGDYTRYYTISVVY